MNSNITELITQACANQLDSYKANRYFLEHFLPNLHRDDSESDEEDDCDGSSSSPSQGSHHTFQEIDAYLDEEEGFVDQDSSAFNQDEDDYDLDSYDLDSYAPPPERDSPHQHHSHHDDRPYSHHDHHEPNYDVPRNHPYSHHERHGPNYDVIDDEDDCDNGNDEDDGSQWHRHEKRSLEVTDPESMPIHEAEFDEELSEEEKDELIIDATYFRPSFPFPWSRLRSNNPEGDTNKDNAEAPGDVNEPALGEPALDQVPGEMPMESTDQIEKNEPAESIEPNEPSGPLWNNHTPEKELNYNETAKVLKSKSTDGVKVMADDNEGSGIKDIAQVLDEPERSARGRRNHSHHEQGTVKDRESEFKLVDGGDDYQQRSRRPGSIDDDREALREDDMRVNFPFWDDDDYYYDHHHDHHHHGHHHPHHHHHHHKTVDIPIPELPLPDPYDIIYHIPMPDLCGHDDGWDDCYDDYCGDYYDHHRHHHHHYQVDNDAPGSGHQVAPSPDQRAVKEKEKVPSGPSGRHSVDNGPGSSPNDEPDSRRYDPIDPIDPIDRIDRIDRPDYRDRHSDRHSDRINAPMPDRYPERYSPRYDRPVDFDDGPPPPPYNRRVSCNRDMGPRPPPPPPPPRRRVPPPANRAYLDDYDRFFAVEDEWPENETNQLVDVKAHRNRNNEIQVAHSLPKNESADNAVASSNLSSTSRAALNNGSRPLVVTPSSSSTLYTPMMGYTLAAIGVTLALRYIAL